MNYYIQVENGIPVGKPYPYMIDGGVPLVVTKPIHDPSFEMLVSGEYVYDSGTNQVTKVFVKSYKPFPEVAAYINGRLDQSRRDTLDKFQKRSVGVSRVYAENLRVAELLIAGNNAVLPTGVTPEQYLTALGTPIGMNAAQFAAYILAENQRLTPSALEVEKRYLQAKASLKSGSVPLLMSAWYNFVTYCRTVITD